MALTHYLAQSLIATTLFYSYGLGWYGRINSWQAMALMAGVWGLQIAVSPWWFRHFTYGPLEAVVRRVSYGRPRPMAQPPPLPPMDMPPSDELQDECNPLPQDLSDTDNPGRAS
jgi:hypothetical protein